LNTFTYIEARLTNKLKAQIIFWTQILLISTWRKDQSHAPKIKSIVIAKLIKVESIQTSQK